MAKRMRKIDLHLVHTASLASRFNPKFLANILAEYAAVVCRILKLSEGFRISLPPEVPARALGTAKMLSQGYSHVHKAVGGPTPCHAGSSRGGWMFFRKDGA